MSEQRHGIFAFRFQDGAARPSVWPDEFKLDHGIRDTWVHLDRTSEISQRWLREHADAAVIDGLLARASRPRYQRIDDGLLITLRGVNLNEGADPADMISLRMWWDPGRLISLEREELKSVQALGQQIASGSGPTMVTGVLYKILCGVTDKIGPVIDDLNEALDELEDAVEDPEQEVDRSDLLNLRRRAIMLHRHLKPQLYVLIDIAAMQLAGMDEDMDLALRDTINKMTRYVEDLDAVKGRAMVIQDELTNRYAERMNSRMYAVTLIATILLPMTILTGLLGINVGGIPGATSSWGFATVFALLGVIGVGGYIIARWSKWL